MLSISNQVTVGGKGNHRTGKINQVGEFEIRALLQKILEDSSDRLQIPGVIP
jgi:hypothetical protein